MSESENDKPNPKSHEDEQSASQLLRNNSPKETQVSNERFDDPRPFSPIKKYSKINRTESGHWNSIILVWLEIGRTNSLINIYFCHRKY